MMLRTLNIFRTIGKKSILTVCVLLMWFSAKGQSFKLPESEFLTYSIYFKWGIIQKYGGSAALNMRPITFRGEEAISFVLAGRTSSFLDNIMRVRDTLKAITSPELKPIYYTKIANEGDWRGVDEMHYRYENNTQAAYLRKIRSGTFRGDTTFYSSKIGYDMMTIFYHIRRFTPTRVGQVFNEIVYSDNQITPLAIIYRGEEQLKTLNKKIYNTQRFQVNLTIKNKGKSSTETMTFWISNDSLRRPVQLTGKLPIGELCAVLD